MRLWAFALIVAATSALVFMATKMHMHDPWQLDRQFHEEMATLKQAHASSLGSDDLRELDRRIDRVATAFASALSLGHNAQEKRGVIERHRLRLTIEGQAMDQYKLAADEFDLCTKSKPLCPIVQHIIKAAIAAAHRRVDANTAQFAEEFQHYANVFAHNADLVADKVLLELSDISEGVASVQRRIWLPLDFHEYYVAGEFLPLVRARIGVVMTGVSIQHFSSRPCCGGSMRNMSFEVETSKSSRRIKQP